MKAAAVQQDVAKHPSLSRVSRLWPDPPRFRPATRGPLAAVPTVRPAPVALSRVALEHALAFAATAIILLGFANSFALFEISFVQVTTAAASSPAVPSSSLSTAEPWREWAC